jgi:hypothetical protein
MRVNAQVFGPDYRARVRNPNHPQAIRLIPDRLFYGLLDITYFADNPLTGEKETISQKLLKVRTSSIGYGLHDYDNPDNIDFSRLKVDDLIANFTFYGGKARAVYEHLTSDDPQKRKSLKELYNLIDSLRGVDMLRPIYMQEQFLIALMALAINPKGGIEYCSQELILDFGNQGNQIYDTLVSQALNDGRWWNGMPNGFEERVFEAFQARDTKTVSENTWESLPFVGFLRRTAEDFPREQARRRAKELATRSGITP